jgi:hypothetical protein
MGGAPLWAQAVTFTPGGLAEFMLGADGKAGTQLDDQYLGERHETDDCCFGAHVKAVALLTDGELGDFPRLGLAPASAAAARGGGGGHGGRCFRRSC